MSALKKFSFVRGRHRRKMDLFWSLWSTNIDDDVNKLNQSLVNLNKGRKDKYQRVIKTVTKSELRGKSVKE